MLCLSLMANGTVKGTFSFEFFSFSNLIFNIPRARFLFPRKIEFEELLGRPLWLVFPGGQKVVGAIGVVVKTLAKKSRFS